MIIRKLMTITVAICVAVAAYLPLAAAECGVGTLRLLSYNVRHCSGKEGPIHYSQTAAAIQREAHVTPDWTTSDHKPVFVSVAVASSSQGENLQKGK